MNAALPNSLLAAVEMAPRDPILGVSETFNADPNPRKVNLGVGVYYDDDGKPGPQCVGAQSARIEEKGTDSYLPIDGIVAYDRAVQQLVFEPKRSHAEGRAVTVQGSAERARSRSADFLRAFLPSAQV
jgi:aromatic-amino-acid transaminase